MEAFNEWCLETGRTYRRESEQYDVTRHLTTQMQIYHGRASYLIDYCDQNPPFFMKNFVTYTAGNPYDNFVRDTEEIRQSWRRVKDIKDLTRRELDAFMNVIRVIEHFDVLEHGLWGPGSPDGVHGGIRRRSLDRPDTLGQGDTERRP